VLVPHRLMPEGKAAFNLALAVATVGGPVLGGLLIALLGPAAALAVNAGSFVIAAALIRSAPGLRAAPAEQSGQGAARREGLRASLKYVAAHRALRTLVFGEGVAFVFFYLVVPVTVVYATRSLHAGTSGYAVILASWGAGIVIGSLAHVQLAGRLGPAMILVSTLAVAAGYLGTAVAPTLVVAGAASVVGGVGNGMQWVSVETTVHGLVEEKFRLRVAAVLEAMAALAPGAGIVLGGTLTALLSARAAYLAAGLGLLALVLFAAAASRPRRARVRLGPGGPSRTGVQRAATTDLFSR
jgi:MFS family permease